MLEHDALLNSFLSAPQLEVPLDTVLQIYKEGHVLEQRVVVMRERCDTSCKIVGSLGIGNL